MFANLFEDKKQQEIEMPADGISLDLLRAVYRSNQLPLTTRMRAAIAALPFEVPKLAVTAVVSEQDFATLLDRRLARIAEAKANATKPQMIDGEPQVEAKPALPRLADRRYRRF